MASYGADTARWFMLSDSPPDRDVIWTEEGVQGASTFVQRVWRLVGELAGVAAPVGAPAPAEMSERGAGGPQGRSRSADQGRGEYRRLRFNLCIAHIHELANRSRPPSAPSRPGRAGADLRFAFREAADMFVQLVAPFMPHLAEECWAALGHELAGGRDPWPVADRAIAREDLVILPVQVNGRKRGDLVIGRTADVGSIEAAAMALEPSAAPLMAGRRRRSSWFRRGSSMSWLDALPAPRLRRTSVFASLASLALGGCFRPMYGPGAAVALGPGRAAGDHGRPDPGADRALSAATN